MCQATVYLARDGQANERIMEDVTRLDVVEGGVRIAAFFEEPRVIPARMEAAKRDLEDAIEHLGGQVEHHSHHHHDHINH